jgi:hypothetical protein
LLVEEHIDPVGDAASRAVPVTAVEVAIEFFLRDDG